MNKSKFLKRSLAAILAILMVVAMVPSALAAQVVNESVPTARVFADPGYSIWVDNKEAQWDEDNNAYTAESSFDEGSSVATNFNVSMIQNVASTTVTVKETGDVLKNSNAQIPNAKATKVVDAFGAGTYTYTLVAEKTDADGVVVETTEYKLIITVTMKVKSADATIKAIKTAKMSDGVNAVKAISAKFDNDKGTIDIVLALGQAKPTDIVNEKTVFIPSSSDASVAVDFTSGTTDTITVTAANGSKKIYNINYSWESAFDTFKLGDYEGKIDTKTSNTAATTVTIDLPYSYTDSGAVSTTEANKLIASWTTDNEVKINGDVATSGEKVLAFSSTTGTWTDPATGLDYWTNTLSGYVTVQTKKSGAHVSMDVVIRSPQKNPSAELTGIKVGDGQYIPITGTTTPVALPAGVDINTAKTVTVWGAKNAKVELAKDQSTSGGSQQKFSADGLGEPIDDTDKGDFSATSNTTLKVDAPLVFQVKSEDGKHEAFYTVNIKDSTTSAFPRLESIELYDATTKKVVASVSGSAIDHSKKEIELVVPFATGVDPTDTAFKNLQIRAKADSASRVGFGVAAVDAAAAVKAKYSIEITAATAYSDSDTITVGSQTVSVKDDGSGNITSTDSGDTTKLAAAIAAKLTDTDYDISSNGAKIIFEAKTAGAVGGSTPSVPGSAPTTLTASGGNGSITFGSVAVETAGKDEVSAVPASFNEHIYIAGTDTVDSRLDIDTYDADAGNANDTTIPTTGTTDPGYNNTFAITAQNDNTTNNQNVYTVTIKKAAASTKADITAAEVALGDVTTISNSTTTYSAVVRGKKITVDLPYALEKSAKAGTTNAQKMTFTKLDFSDNARVVWVASTAANSKIMKVTETAGVKTASDAFDTWSDTNKTNSWATAGKEVTLYVFSEAAWDSIAPDAGGAGYDADRLATIITELGTTLTVPPTAVYRMSATYAAAEKGASLSSIKSTVDPNVKAEHDSNTIAITVPGSYVAASDTDAKAFSLDIDVSKLATVHSGNDTTTTTLVKPDEGKATTSGRTLFKVVGSSAPYTLKFSIDGGSSYSNFASKLFVISEDENSRNSWNVKVNVNAKETSADIESITAAGVSAVKDPADPYVWNLQISSTADKLQKMDIKTTSKLAAVTVDGAEHKADNYYDLGADMAITVTSEDGNNVVNYTLKITDDGAAANTDLAEVRAGAYNGTKGANNAWTIKVPEGTDMSNPSLTLSTVDSSAKVTSVNGAAYTAGMTVDLSAGKTLTIVVTAADGTKGTHTVTAQFGAANPSELYKDIPSGGMGDWVEKAINYGIMGDTGTAADGKLLFAPKETTQRRWFALMVARADIMASDNTITDKDAADKKLLADYGDKEPNFTDTASEADTAKAAIAYCQDKGIMNGDAGKFNPAGIVNRMEAASILANWLKLTEGGKENTHQFKDWARIPDWAKGNINAVAADGIMNGHDDGNFGIENLTREQTAVIMVKAYERLKDSK